MTEAKEAGNRESKRKKNEEAVGRNIEIKYKRRRMRKSKRKKRRKHGNLREEEDEEEEGGEGEKGTWRSGTKRSNKISGYNYKKLQRQTPYWRGLNSILN